MYKIIGGDGKQYGPVTADQMRQWASEGRVNAQTRVQREGSDGWVALGEVDELRLPPPIPGATGAMPAARHQLTNFPTAVVVLLHFLTLGIFTLVWLNLMHGKLPRVRSDDPSAGRGIGFCFIPLFNLYWIFFTYRRLCLRLEEQRRLYGMPEGDLTGLATTACILQVIPYINLIGFLITAPIFAGMVQSRVNELVDTSATTAPRGDLAVSQAPAPGLSGCLIAAIVGVCIIPVIGLLAAIAIPSFVHAREVAQRTACMNNMRLIDHAKEQAALEHGYKDGDTIPVQEVSSGLKGGLSAITCPKGGQYTIHPEGQEVECSVHGSTSAPWPSHGR